MIKENLKNYTREELEQLRVENAYLKKLDALLQKKEQAKKANLLPKKKRV